VAVRFEAKALKYGDDINTDIIIPGKYLVLTDVEELAKHAMEGIDPSFYEKSRGGVILVAGENFGSGSSREHAPIALKHAEVRCVVAKSFARIFYRNSINIGLPVLECREIWGEVSDGDLLRVELENGLIEDVTTGRSFKAEALPRFILELIEAGGLLNRLKQALQGA